MQQHHPQLTVRRIALLLVLVGTVATGAVVLADTGRAQTSVSVDSFEAASVEKTVSGDVTDVQVTADIGYNYSVPDAEDRFIELHAGPSESEMQQLTFIRASDPAGDDRGSVTLEGSLLEAGFNAEQFDPAEADSTTTEVVVKAVIEVDRANGETVRREVTDTATITLNDSGEITATLGGEAEFVIGTTDE